MSITTKCPADLKIILLGDSAVGKSKLMERFLLNDYETHQDSTYALTLYRYTTPHPSHTASNISPNSQMINIDFWDTAGYFVINVVKNGSSQCIQATTWVRIAVF